MATTAKKADAPTKPRKTTTKNKAVPASRIRVMVSHEEVAHLAHRYWTERGHLHGQAEEDWLRAEQELRGKAS
jgi:hypothetical protein